MAAYTVVISSSTGSYTFDVSRSPAWGITSEAEYDTAKAPATLARVLETLTLRGCSYRHATPATVRTDWATLKALLFDRTTPVQKVELKDGAVVVESMVLSSISGGTHDSVMIERLDPDVEPGFFGSHWKGTIVVKGIRSYADTAGIIKRTRTLASSFDQHGFETRTLTVTVETQPGTSAAAALEAEVIEPPGPQWLVVTNDPDGGPDVTVEDPTTEDTKASSRYVIREQALSVPSGAGEYTINVTTEDSGEDQETRYVVTAQAATLAAAKAIAARSPAPSAYARSSVHEERASNRVTATYIVRGDTKLRVRRWRLSASGGGLEREAIRFPSIGGKRRPIPFRRPRGEYTFYEEITVQQRGVANPPAPSCFASTADLETHTSSDVCELVEQGSAQSQHLYERSVSRVHRFFGAPPTAASLLARMLTRPLSATTTEWAYEQAEARP